MNVKNTCIRLCLICVVVLLGIIFAIGELIAHYRLNIYNVGQGSEITFFLLEPHGRKEEMWKISFYGKDQYISCHIHKLFQQKQYNSLLTAEQIEILNRNLFKITRKSAIPLLRWYLTIWKTPKVRPQVPLLLDVNHPAYPIFDRVIYLSTLPTYRIKEGETLSSIALELFGDRKKIQEILSVNPLLDENAIQAGRTIRLPE